ncbi:hypothetical protein JHD48_04665 [Sulfurimonas sp. SAG-AH-194-I05]|nr:Mur ligase family protein [Sulfurimonas sp. SAG-AH-194-I05]MDF1875022.1 hypothetical protein [Sulfurimonas sp. SAG-AH-194-I05]
MNLKRTSFLTLDDLARITGGYWINKKNEMLFCEVTHVYEYLKENDLFVIYDASWYDRDRTNIHQIARAIKKDITGIIIKEGTQKDISIPALVVEDTFFALKEIALANAELSSSKRLIVTGSFGKTAFKGQLYHVLKKQFVTYARLSSANRVVPMYCNLASLKKEDEILIIEQPIAKKNKPSVRAKFVKPNILVITSIGHEHIEGYGTIKNIVKKKISMAKALKKGSKIIIPKEDAFYSLIQDELKKYKDIEVCTFGSTKECNAYIIKSEYKNFNWYITASIENVEVSYILPFPEVYAPLASLSVLLSAYYLGADIVESSKEYCNASNFPTSGKFYKIKYNEKTFYLYDQSKRGGIEGYLAFFRTLNYINPEYNGKKIVLTSEFVDYKDGEMKYINISEFRKVIKNANIDILYTVENFQMHESVLESSNLTHKYIENLDAFQEELLNSIEENDLLCVKGIYESNLPDFIDYLKSVDEFFLEEL